MPTDIEIRDRATIARLQECGVRPAGAAGLTFRLACVDQLPPAEVAATLGVAVATVQRRICWVRAKLRAAQDQHAQAQVPDADPDDESDPLTEAARHLLEALRNQQGEGGRASALPAAPVVTLGDVKGVIREAEFRRQQA